MSLKTTIFTHLYDLENYIYILIPLKATGRQRSHKSIPYILKTLYPEDPSLWINNIKIIKHTSK